LAYVTSSLGFIVGGIDVLIIGLN